MKKLAVFFAVLLGLTVLYGCKSTKNTASAPSGQTGSKTEVSLSPSAKTPAAKITAGAISPVSAPVVFAVTYPQGNSLATNKSYHLIKGTAPKNTAKITVNNYTLSKYTPGQTGWSYIASASLGTLQKGSNSYTVKAYDRAGAELGSAVFAINYQGAAVKSSLAKTGNGSIIAAMILSILASGFFYGKQNLWRSRENFLSLKRIF